MNYQKSPKKRLTTSYVIALSLIALLSIASQVVIRTVLAKQEKDARVINISGRQRMLSQKISKMALQLETAKSESQFAELKSEFIEVIELWSSSHHGLKERSEEMDLQGENSETVTKMFEGIAVNYESIFDASNKILEFESPDGIEEYVNIILQNEASFLRQMNVITFQYDHESTSRIKEVENIETILLAITLISILLEAFFIFRPAVAAIDKFLNETMQRGLALKEAHQSLLTSNLEKETVEKELFEQLQMNHNMQLSYNKDLEDKIEERTREIEDQKEEILQQSNELLEQNEVVSKVNKKLTDSISYAKKLQQSIFSKREDILEQFVDGFIIDKPRDIISGDFYWYYSKDDIRFIVVADCTGHGVSAAFMTIIGNLLLNDIVVNQKVVSPKEILNFLDMELYALMNLKNVEKISDGMDIGLVTINSEKREIEFVGAKRPLYVASGNEDVKKIEGSKSTIGYHTKDTKKEFEPTLLTYQKGDRLYLVTDGFQDQFGGNNESKFLQKRFIDALNRTNGFDMIKQKKVLEGVFDKWKGSNEQTDDVLVLGVEL
ncbi:SpoIIE family protein phosphatase [Flammeovirga yaeyamensis]|uniref:SpoIIE family protein phosphatase n=1 Tax=Flammeovirga yaeyamensis TaxID=367791 RepID=A0AAX1N736_9BACT|nr:SpoIIE family protein phosphatase [Flammeovirga yaeyamensis]MBB3697877.1 serine phosphatase RsbU (regulator of sigma subunit) [Flammeovirga yaeyamensis]NMF35768.1 SpoIIE family protein phosphatase [Flammeovirga yaeyamensis]QWG03280.1 SpoIIE family protein phosphatase [Flammeovirga yaeyamensis]